MSKVGYTHLPRQRLKQSTARYAHFLKEQIVRLNHLIGHQPPSGDIRALIGMNNNRFWMDSHRTWSIALVLCMACLTSAIGEPQISRSNGWSRDLGPGMTPAGTHLPP